MTTEKSILLSVVTLAATLFLAADVLPQAVAGRDSHGGAIQRARLGEVATPFLSKCLAADPLPAGSYTVGTAGYFPTLDSAFNRLSGGGILGSVTLLLTDTLYVASPAHNNMFSLAGPITGTGPASRITIRPADNVAVVIQGNGTATMTLEDVSYLTLDGISLQGSTTLTVHTLPNMSYEWNDAIDLLKNCDHVVIQNLTASTDDIASLATATINLQGDASGAPDSCLISGVAVTSGPIGIFVGGVYPSYAIRPRGNVVRGNHIGSPTDSLISRGIQIEGADGTIIENNHIEHLGLTFRDLDGDGYIIGLNAYFCRDAIIRNNAVHNVGATISQTYIDGIFLTGDSTQNSTQKGANNWVYNNMVYDIRTRVSQNVDLNGIGAWRQDSARIDYNSVYLSPTGGTFASVGTAALAFYSTASLSTARNNILVNTRNDSLGGAFGIWFGGTCRLSDHNNLYVGPYTNSNVAQYAAVAYRTLSTAQLAGKEVHSVSVMPTFGSPYLHLDSTSTVNGQLGGGAIPLSGIATDFDGQVRSSSAPVIGADEVIIVGVPDELGMPEEYALSQNYPNPFNPSTTIKYDLPTSLHVSLTVYDILGREVSVLVNERKNAGVHEVKFDGPDLASGVYFYRLQAGDFTQTKRMMILK
jgi:hypothetical protein